MMMLPQNMKDQYAEATAHKEDRERYERNDCG